ncbi:hypothetical protein ACOSQ4_019706 [Xanthoceras sorbifolium]
MGRYIRVRVGVNIDKPLKRCLRVDLGGSNGIVALLLCYERLSEFCFECGLVGHSVRECVKARSSGGEIGNTQHSFGPWLRASSPPRVGGRRPNREAFEEGNQSTLDARRDSMHGEERASVVDDQGVETIQRPVPLQDSGRHGVASLHGTRTTSSIRVSESPNDSGLVVSGPQVYEDVLLHGEML